MGHIPALFGSLTRNVGSLLPSSTAPKRSGETAGAGNGAVVAYMSAGKGVF